MWNDVYVYIYIHTYLGVYYCGGARNVQLFSGYFRSYTDYTSFCYQGDICEYMIG